MNDCPNGEIRDQLPDYLHERLDSSRRAEVARHLATCADCSAELALLTGLRGAMQRGLVIDVAAIASVVPAYRAPARRSWGGWRTAAAVTLIAAGGSSLAVLGRDRAVSLGAPHVAASSPVAGQPRDSIGALVATTSSVPSNPSSIVSMPTVAARSGTGVRSGSVRELAMGGGTVSDLSESEIAMLVDDLESLDVVPAPDVDPIATSPVAPDEVAP